MRSRARGRWGHEVGVCETPKNKGPAEAGPSKKRETCRRLPASAGAITLGPGASLTSPRRVSGDDVLLWVFLDKSPESDTKRVQNPWLNACEFLAGYATRFVDAPAGLPVATAA